MGEVAFQIQFYTYGLRKYDYGNLLFSEMRTYCTKTWGKATFWLLCRRCRKPRKKTLPVFYWRDNRGTEKLWSKQGFQEFRIFKHRKFDSQGRHDCLILNFLIGRVKERNQERGREGKEGWVRGKSFCNMTFPNKVIETHSIFRGYIILVPGAFLQL